MTRLQRIVTQLRRGSARHSSVATTRWLAVLIWVIACSVDSKQPERQTSTAGESVHADSTEALAFVNRFYEQYALLISDASREPGYYALIAENPSTLSDTLRLALEVERRLQEEAGGGIVHLDSDPFVGSQDPCERYVGSTASRDGSGIRVDVFAVCNGVRQPAPSVTADVRPSATGWRIRDIVYPGANEPSLLKNLARLP